MSSTIMKYILLPKEATEVELRHVQQINRVALWACVAHLPLFMLVAWLAGTSMVQAIGIGGLLVAGPAIATHTLKNPRTLSLVYGFTAMGLGALLVHLGQGPMQIEMHFHFFAALALLTVWGNPTIIWVATVTVALHHALFWLFIPKSVFNYDASIWVVVVHATFVVVEAIAAAFIARNFFDNVIGLEKIVQAKTQEVRRRNEDMKTILDNTAQGFMTVAMDGVIEPERSAVLSSWLGDIGTRSLFDLFAPIDDQFALRLQLGWEEFREDIMPMEVTLEQLPKMLKDGGRCLGFEYRAIMNGERIEKILVVISDLTAEVERARMEDAQRETMVIFDRVNRDRNGFLEFVEEGLKLVRSIGDGSLQGEGELWRAVHTLKGNAGLFGIMSVAEYCHTIEDEMAEDKLGIRPESVGTLERIWRELTEKVSTFTVSEARVYVQENDILDALTRLRGGLSVEETAQLIASWRYEPLHARFGRFTEQAKAIAKRLGRDPVQIEVSDGGLRLPQQKWAPFWASFSHAIRNSIDHGIETPEHREALGKGAAVVRFTAAVVNSRLTVSIEDDGRGIDWNAVARKCEDHGLPFETHEQLLEALLSDGFSTRSEATAVSGRGIGMGSLRQECRRLGGQMSIASEAGKGTKLLFTFPLEAMLERGPRSLPPSAHAP